jgi:hypothetical protein
MSRTDFVPDKKINKLMQFGKTGNRHSSLGIPAGYNVADQLITKEPNRDILEKQRATYEAAKALITETSLVITQNYWVFGLCPSSGF